MIASGCGWLSCVARRVTFWGLRMSLYCALHHSLKHNKIFQTWYWIFNRKVLQDSSTALVAGVVVVSLLDIIQINFRGDISTHLFTLNLTLLSCKRFFVSAVFLAPSSLPYNFIIIRLANVLFIVYWIDIIYLLFFIIAFERRCRYRLNILSCRW